MKRVILRIDDVCAYTDTADLQALYGPCWERGSPVCLAVIPHTAYRFGPDGPLPAQPADIRHNAELVEALGRHIRAGLVEIALHGWQHHYGEWALPGEIENRIVPGREVLEAAWPEMAVRVAVPPHDYLSPHGLRALRGLGLAVCSTWAATHGGTSAAHWRGRLRRLAGLPFARAAHSLWPTDVDLLDFAGPERDNWPITMRLLRLAERWETPVVFVQHPWCISNSRARSDRWRRWLDQIASLPDVQFERFSNDQ
jgi:hypothetical protein